MELFDNSSDGLKRHGALIARDHFANDRQDLFVESLVCGDWGECDHGGLAQPPIIVFEPMG